MIANSHDLIDRASLIHQQTDLAAYQDNGGTIMQKGEGVYVYDEAGNFVDEIDIQADAPVGILYASDILEAIGGGPDFGVFEWDFLDPSFISQEMRAEGRYAAGWAPACLDPAFL